MDIQSLLLVTGLVKCVAKLTFSPKELTDENKLAWTAWAETQIAACIIEESGANQNHPHLEMIVATSMTQKNIRRSIERNVGTFTRIELVVKYPKNAQNVAWCAKYGRKEDGYIIVHEHGWDWKQIEIVGADDLKRVKDYKINKNMRILSGTNAQAIIMEYAKTKAIAIGCKESFKDVIKKMMKEGYQFHNIRGLDGIWCQIEVMLEIPGHCVDSWLDNQLKWV